MTVVHQRTSETGKCVLTWHSDGTLTKEQTPAFAERPLFRSRFEYEAEVNKILARDDPPFPFARLVDADASTMRFVAVDGDPLGEKWGASIDHATLMPLLTIADAIASYEPDAASIQRYAPLEHPLVRIKPELVSPDLRSRIEHVVGSREWPFAFAHGDFIPRNMLASRDGIVLIDWEFAGFYPSGFDRAFLWVVLNRTPAAREAIVSSTPDEILDPFWLNVCLIELLHIGMIAERYPDSEFLPPLRAECIDVMDRTFGPR